MNIGAQNPDSPPWFTHSSSIPSSYSPTPSPPLTHLSTSSLTSTSTSSLDLTSNVSPPAAPPLFSTPVSAQALHSLGRAGCQYWKFMLFGFIGEVIAFERLGRS